MVTDQVGIGLGYVGRDGVAFRGRLPFGATMISARSALVAFVIASWHTRGDRIALCVDGRGPWVLGSQAGLRERSRRARFGIRRFVELVIVGVGWLKSAGYGGTHALPIFGCLRSRGESYAYPSCRRNLRTL